ncbi:MAG: hypothetical protein WCF12_16915 [Propionicimonas sp.]
MGRRFLWFTVGVGLTLFIVVKGREYYEKFTPKGVATQLDKTRAAATDWIGEFITTMGEAMDEREGELREALGLDG